MFLYCMKSQKFYSNKSDSIEKKITYNIILLHKLFSYGPFFYMNNFPGL